MCNKELHNLHAYYSDQMKRVRWSGHISCMGVMRNKILVGKPEGKRSLARPWSGWEDELRMNPREMEWEIVD
jgi:hypothetical protein